MAHCDRVVFHQVRKRKSFRGTIANKFLMQMIVSYLVFSIDINVAIEIQEVTTDISTTTPKSSVPVISTNRSLAAPKTHSNFLVASSFNHRHNTTTISSHSDSTTKNKLLREVNQHNKKFPKENDNSLLQNNHKKKSKRKMIRTDRGENRIHLRQNKRRDRYDATSVQSGRIFNKPKISFNRNHVNNVTNLNNNSINNDSDLFYRRDQVVNKTMEEKIRTKKGQLLIREDEGYVIYHTYRGVVPCPPGYPRRHRTRECRCSIHGSTGRGCHRATGQCDCLPNVTGRKCDMCMPGFWNLTSHVGCSSCACHASGSRDNLCDTVTGRCVCKSGVGGYRCDRCLDQFYGLSSQGCQPCDQCPTPGYICDPFTGGCICPPNAKGTDCQHCQANTWNWKHRIGCENCECDAAGSIGQLCDVRSGQCTCREGYTGRSCDSCGVGYFGYPDCKRCNCNVHGSETRSDGLVQCDYRGQCPCKSLVTGLKCDICRQHTFGLHKSNAEGCTRCFCFQRSQECSQSDLSWGLIRMQGARNLSIQYVSPETVPVDEYEYIVLVQMEGTETYEQDAEIQTLNTLNLIPSSTGNVSIGAYTAFYYPLYFQLPPQFYGDRTKSYGGSLRFSLLTEGSGTLLNRNVLQQSPLVQIHSHHKLILEYYQDEPRNISSNESFVVPLHESVWRLHSSNERNVSRGLMMAALQNVKHIFLRGTSWADFTEVVMYNVRMDSAIYLAGSTNILAYGVEQCLCPTRYESLSCQDPGKGFYRQRNRTSHSLEDIVGRAIPCHCNSRSDDCDRETGFCLNCRENSGGENCQRCAEGFYGDPNIGECRACPCPETSRNYAKGCTVWKGKVHCICKPGYGGELCDMCSKGYFGLPGTPNGKCEPCNCNLEGIVSDECEEENGQCNCRAGVVGRKCDRCTTERHVLEDRRCQLCDNCTLTLLDTIENTSNQLRRGISHIDLTGISAPYGKVDDYDEKLSDLDDWFTDFSKAKDTLVSFDGNEIDKLLSHTEDLKIQSRKQHDTVVKSRTKSQDILNNAKNALIEVQNMRTGIQGTIVALNNYGSNPSHTNLEKALHEAIPILEELKAHRDDRESYKGIWKCAADKFYYFGNTSDVVQDQLVALEKFSINMSRFNHRVSDIILNTDNTVDIIREAGDIHEHNMNLKSYFVEDYGSIRDYEENLLKLLNNSLITDGNILVEMINKDMMEIETNYLKKFENLVYPLAKKLNETDVDLRNIKRHWLPKAKKHANRLRDRAKEYADKFQTTKDGAKVALLASTAHQNISNAINAAREAAKKAQASANLAQEKLYTSDSISMTERGHDSLQESRQLEKDAIEKMRKITELRKDLKFNENNVEDIKSTIRRAGTKNNDISLVLEKLTNNASMKSLRDNIELASELSKDMKEEGEKAFALDKDIKRLREKFAKLEPDWESKLGLAEENVTEIQSNLIKANNSLIKIEMEARRYNQDFEVANRTLGRQLQELKDKIAKAKHAAEGIKVSMDPTAVRCIRSYLPPSYGLSTSNTIKLTLALVRDAKDSPVVFIQGNGTDFIAVEMIKRRIRLLWNLGGQTEVVTHPLELDILDAKIDEAWYQIDVNRTLNIGSLLVQRMTNSSTLMTEMPGVTAATDHKHTRFLRTPSNLVWIGGVPDSLRVKELQANPGLNVVLHQVNIDGKSLGLWNFASEDGKCGGAISGPQDASLNSNSRYFNGEGYAELKISRSRPYRKNRFAIQMAFRTFDENALLFLAVDDKNNRSISITLNYGRILFRIDYGKESKLEIVTTQRYNTGKETRIEAAREFVPKGITENGSLKVNTDESLNGSPTAPITSAMLPDLSKASYYLGGVPPGFRSGITKAPGADNRYMGCMMDVQINGETYDPLEGVTFFGVDQSCKTAIKRAGFYGKGYVELPSQSLYKRANAGFVFRTLQLECLLLLSAYPPNSESDYDSSDLKGNYSISLIDGKVHVWLQTGRGKLEMASKQTVNDGEYHVLNLIKNGRKVELTLDDELQWSKSLTGKPAQVSMPQDAGGLYFGGAPAFESYKPLAATFVPFEGAIRDVVFNNKTLLFSDTVAFENVQIGRSGPEMGMINGNGDILMKTEPIGKSFTATPEGCQRVGSYSYEPNAFKFGDGPYSHSQLNITVRNFWQKNFNIRFDFRTFYPNGAILTAPGTKEKQKHFVNLLLKDGQLVLRVRGRKKVELLLAAKLNDGQWHQVSISCMERKVTMSVEIGDTGQKTSTQVKIPKKVSASNNMFVGGIPENGVTLPMEVEGFKGCIRKMTINNSTKDLARPGKHVNVGQCFPRVEKGSYFPGDAYAIYKKNFHVGKYLELEIDFRTSELNGVLLSVSEPNGFPALSLEIHNGNVVLSCDLGDGNPFRVESVYPTKYALCDNKWHNISALYDLEQITLRIDNRPAIISMAQTRVDRKVHTKSSLYIGGLPDIAPSGTLLSRENFKGCIRNVSIRNERRDWIDMDGLHNVLLSECLAVN